MIALLLIAALQETPRLEGQPWTLAGNPDLGELTDPKQQPVDFAVWQAVDGTWQLWSCIRHTKGGGKTRLLHRWEGKSLTDRDWAPKGVAMQADPSLGETPGGLQAPHVVKLDGLYHLFYGDWENIRRATSSDGKTFARAGGALFHEGTNTRDPMLFRAGDLWHCLTTAHPGNKGAVYSRTSTDLLTWTDPKVVARGGEAGDGPYSAECPFVVERKGWFYLFRTQKYGKDARTTVHRSRDPRDFGVDDDRGRVCTLPVAAPEIVTQDGQDYLVYLLPSLQGIQISKLAWTEEPPVLPVGLDAYRMWDRWPLQRLGQRAYLRSTYDRRGNNESADASHFLYQESDAFNVSLDVQGPGILAFARYNHWHGSPWHYEVDGTDHLVQESTSADPTKKVPNSVFLPEAAFPNPLTWTWSTTKGADLMWVPIPFEKSFRMAYTRTRYGTGYYIFHQFARGAKLSRPIQAWKAEPPDPAVLDLLRRSGSDIAPPGKESSGSTIELQGPATIRALTMSLPRDKALALERARLRITWDGRPAPSVDVPLALFFGAGTFYNRDGREWMVKAFPMSVRFDAERVHLACYYPMPFFKSARLELAGAEGVAMTARTVPNTEPESHVGTFHATYVDIPEPVRGQDMVLLDTKDVEGSALWTGSFVGMSWIFSHQANLGTLEGDPRFFFDDARTPQAYGTGTEEWGGGGDYWGGQNMTLPFAGHPAGARHPKEAKAPEDLVNSAYRFLLADLMPFGRRAVIRLEHGGRNESKEHYESVVYWYGRPGTSLALSDDLDVGDPDSERAHRYDAPEATPPQELVSRFEWGPDSLDGKEIYPAHAETGRRTKTASEFTLKLDPANVGALLRRTFDYECPNQRAEVFVADEGSSEFKPAGTWYTAGANTCVYSDPKGELGATLHHVQTSNRRFRDDEFLLPRDLTQGRSSIRVRVVFKAVDRPLFPGTPYPGEIAWSEIAYRAYSIVMPR